MYKNLKLTDVGTLKRGKSKHRPRNDKILFGGEYPFIQTGDIKRAGWKITEFSNTYNEIGLAQSKLWGKGTLCITIAANIADTSILDFPACFPDSVLGFIPYENIANVYYIDYALRKFKIKLDKLATKTAQKNINLATFESIVLSIPEIDVQNELINKIVPFDEKILINKKLINQLESHVSLLFDKWFLEFNFPNSMSLPFKTNGGKLFKINGKLIPEGWTIEKLENLVNITTGKKDANQSSIDGIYPFFTCSETQLKSNTYSFDTKAIILAGNGEFWLNKYEGKFEAYQRNYVIQPKNKEMFDYLYMYLQKFKKRITTQSNGSIVKYLTKEMITELEVVVPSIEVILNLSQEISPFLLKIDILKQEIEQLKKIRDLLIYKLIK